MLYEVITLYGGTTTIIDFVTPARGQSLVEALQIRKEEAKNSLVDYKFHVSPVEWTQNTKNEIIHCIEKEGVRSFKVYMAYNVITSYSIHYTKLYEPNPLSALQKEPETNQKP